MFNERNLIKEALAIQRSETERRRQKNQLIKFAKAHKASRQSQQVAAIRHKPVRRWWSIVTLMTQFHAWMRNTEHQQQSFVTDNCIEEPNPC